MNSLTHAPLPGTKPMTTLQGILRSAPQDLWLDTIRRTKGNVHRNLVHWMLNQPECDLAVALHAFYRSDPLDRLDNPRPLPAQPDANQIFGQILRNWDTGFYRKHNLRVDLGPAETRLIRRMNQKILAWPRGALPFQIPTEFLAPTGGKPVQLPPHLSPDQAPNLRSLYQSLDLEVTARKSNVLLAHLAKAKVLFHATKPEGQ